MMGTFIIEAALALWVVARYRLDTFGRMATSILLLLATFQAVEYSICEISTDRIFAVIGYIAITWLPAIALHLAIKLSRGPFIGAVPGYLLAALWTGLFVLYPSIIQTVSCSGNYTVLSLTDPYAVLYGFYYYGLLVAGLVISIFGRTKSPVDMRQARGWLALSYLLMMVPTYAVNTLNPETVRAIPSIMCGFAVTFAIILALRIMPLVGTKR